MLTTTHMLPVLLLGEKLLIWRNMKVLLCTVGPGSSPLKSCGVNDNTQVNVFSFFLFFSPYYSVSGVISLPVGYDTYLMKVENSQLSTTTKPVNWVGGRFEAQSHNHRPRTTWPWVSHFLALNLFIYSRL